MVRSHPVALQHRRPRQCPAASVHPRASAEGVRSQVAASCMSIETLSNRVAGGLSAVIWPAAAAAAAAAAAVSAGIPPITVPSIAGRLCQLTALRE